MKTVIILAIFFSLSFSAQGQAWEIFNTELKAEKQGKDILISFLDDRKSLLVEADSIFWDLEFEFLFIINNGLLGIVDPLDLVLVQEPKFYSINILDGVYFLAEDQEGFYFTYPEFPILAISEKFQSVERLYKRKEVSQGDEEAYLIRKNDKYGIILPYLGFANFLVKPQFDEIVPGEFRGQGQIYYLRKNNKWGAGSCEGLEIEAKYDHLRMLKGECGAACYIAQNNGLEGLIESNQKKPLIKLEYNRIELLLKEQSEYLLLFKNGKLEKLLLVNNYDDWFSEFEPLMILNIGSKDEKNLICKGKSEMIYLKLSEEELERLGLQSLDWLHIE